MLLEFIAIIAAGFSAAGIVLLLNILVRRRIPGWVAPAAAGAGMLAMAIWLEYSWFSRAAGTLPDGVEVASTNEVRAWYRPWTFVVPQVNRFIAVDQRFARRHADMPDQVLTSVILMGRWEPTRQIGVVYDCAGHRRADLVDQVRLGDDGRLVNAQWVSLAPDDRVMQVACRR